VEAQRDAFAAGDAKRYMGGILREATEGDGIAAAGCRPSRERHRTLSHNGRAILDSRRASG
jgi:hypothetical protein